ncbi:dephospho-CoA kinase [Rhodobacteraceae bacterium CCMM004]|nr:dephospho-CoA kinase [Rhodobacteraceae bacterium CCMM004]
MSAPFTIGLTGSIGMGKSATAALFAEEGCAVWDADAAVHRLYSVGGAAVKGIAQLRPQAVRDGAVDRPALKAWIAEDADALPRIEAVVHPLVAADRAAFLAETQADIAVLDVPLLFETGGADAVDMVVVVSVPAEIQRARVLERPGMTAAQFQTILAAQMPDSEKRRRADVVIETHTPEGAKAAVQGLVRRIRQGDHHA